MRATSKLLALALTATMQSAMAGAVFLDFEDVQATELLTNRYAAKGVTGSGAAWTATSEACTYGPNNDSGDISFFRSGSCGALLLAQDWTKPAPAISKSLTLSLSDRFEGLSFVYSGSVAAINLSVHVFDGVGNELNLFDANGKDLGLGLSGLAGSPCTSTLTFCNWSSLLELSFQGVARSVVFSATDQTVLLDDISFKTSDPTGRLPEPASIALVLGALGGLGWSRRRAAR
ncbi:hypothetical protein ASC95_05805 [Pelomonas sp. Root1217]|uniref:PEP-CTERM sorting domain-containing protein n=1 Tax=Pelomonas sp. Root1217 TaxID=1736430 RepID=UPI00070C034C|nr:PEP-CTERM sorting domain-containing protein [Pelomonas sp. Root1217]KQV60937.1 hypothetical protein ASC95_05805 [Pelomonas sp. Root1217]